MVIIPAINLLDIKEKPMLYKSVQRNKICMYLEAKSVGVSRLILTNYIKALLYILFDDFN